MADGKVDKQVDSPFGEITIDKEWDYRNRWWVVAICDGEYVEQYYCKSADPIVLGAKIQGFKDDFELRRYMTKRSEKMSEADSGVDGLGPQEDKAELTAREAAYGAIDQERDYQQTAWPNSGNLSVGEEIVLLKRYVDKAAVLWAELPGDEMALNAIRKVAGIAVRCMENHGAPPRVVVGFPPPNPPMKQEEKERVEWPTDERPT